MSDPQPQMDPAQLRISDADRHKVADFLRDAAGEGRLDLDELDDRLERAYAAKVYADLLPITQDLPGAGDTSSLVPLSQDATAAVPQPPRPAEPVLPAASHRNSIAVMSGVDRRGIWLVPHQHTAFTMMGGIELDLREAQFESPEVTISATAIMGGIDIIVNERTRVMVEGVGIMGGFEQARDKVDPEITEDSQVVRVTGMALMAGVTVTRKGPPKAKRSLRKRLGH